MERTAPGEVHGHASYDPVTRKLIVARRFAKKHKPLVTVYQVDRLDPNVEIGNPAFRLTQPNGEIYDVIRTAYGTECSCPDWISRRQQKGTHCKHIRALQAGGLLPRGR